MARLKTDLTPEDRELILAFSNELPIKTIAEKFERTPQRIRKIVVEMWNERFHESLKNRRK